MGLRIRRSGRLFHDVWMRSSFGASGSRVSFPESSSGNGPFLLGAGLLLLISALVWLLP